MSEEKSIEQVLADETPGWLALPGVEGTALGLSEDGPCIIVLVSVEPERLRPPIPESVEGYPVVLEHTGGIRALDQG